MEKKMIVLQTDLHSYIPEKNADKVYHVALVQSGDDYEVLTAYAKRGGGLNYGSKTKGPVGQAEAQRIFDETVKGQINHRKTPYKVVPGISGDVMFPGVDAPYQHPKTGPGR